VRPDVDTAIVEAIRNRAGTEIPPDLSFFTAGLTSSVIAAIHTELQERLGRQFPIAVFFRHPTRSALARFLAEDAEDTVAAPEPTAVAAGGTGWTPRTRRDLRAQLWQRKG
jgi:phosphopantetheine binding protein